MKEENPLLKRERIFVWVIILGLLDHVADFPTGLLQQVMGFFCGDAGHLHQDGDAGVSAGFLCQFLRLFSILFSTIDFPADQVTPLSFC
ncbi:glutathione peroxidase [Desmospora sp. 8437]|nr:glutathione peroxidase [Desmospora sp. 8437]